MLNKINDDDVEKFTNEYNNYKLGLSNKINNVIKELCCFEKNNKEKIDIDRVNFSKKRSEHTQYQFALIFCAFFPLNIVHKKHLTEAWKRCGNITNDFQGHRHVGGQCGYPLFSSGEKIENYTLLPGEVCYVKDTIPGKYEVLKRKGNAELKSNVCMCCHSVEGEINYRDGTITRIEKGHKETNKSLTDENLISLCSYCNKTHKDCNFLPNGAPIPIKNVK